MASEYNQSGVVVYDRYVSGSITDSNPGSSAEGIQGSLTGIYTRLGLLETFQATWEAEKRYVVLLTQSGTSAPTATVLWNNLGGTPVWSYVSTGVYRLTLTGAFASSKTWARPVWAGTVELTWDLTGQPDYIELHSVAVANGEMTTTPVEVRTYP